MRTLEWLGRTAGVIAAPITGGVARLRHARAFHPAGVIHRATISVHPAARDELRAVGERLTGPALVRLSSAWWKRGELPDLLGIGVRIGDGSTPPQDLLFATSRSIVTLLPAVLSTNVHDFLANDYFAMAPFRIDGIGRARMRLRGRAPSPPGVEPTGADRDTRLLRAVKEGTAVFDLAVAPAGHGYREVAQLVLGERLERLPRSDGLELDQRLELSPENVGRGIHPVGFVNATRRAAYAASRRGRGAH